MAKEQVFYYHFKKNYVWLVLNLLMLGPLLSCCLRHPACFYWWQFQVLIGLFGVTLLLWGYKYLCKHTLAVVSETGIKIDHCQILRWDDIVSAEYRQARCCFRRLPIIILRPRQGLKYHYNYLQKRCAQMDFTAFSIPLYDITKEDSRILQQIIAEQVGVIRK